MRFPPRAAPALRRRCSRRSSAPSATRRSGPSSCSAPRSPPTACSKARPAHVLYLTTEGFEDIPEFIQRVDRQSLLCDLAWLKAAPLRRPARLPRGAASASPTTGASGSRWSTEIEGRGGVAEVAARQRRVARRRGGRRQPALRLRRDASHELGGREALGDDVRSRSPTRSRRSGASTSAAPPRSSTRTSARASATSPASTKGWRRTGAGARWSLLKSNGGHGLPERGEPSARRTCSVGDRGGRDRRAHFARRRTRPRHDARHGRDQRRRRRARRRRSADRVGVRDRVRPARRRPVVELEARSGPVVARSAGRPGGGLAGRAAERRRRAGPRRLRARRRGEP